MPMFNPKGVNVGDTVYLIYAGKVTVQGVYNNGDILFYLGDKETLHMANIAQYRTMDRMDAVSHPTKDNDYTTEVRAI